MKVQIGSISAVGYVSNIAQVGFYDHQIELTKVAWIVGKEIEFKKPTQGLYGEDQLEPVGDFWDKLQDKSAFIDLALLTRDEKWFRELMGEKQKWHTVEQ